MNDEECPGCGSALKDREEKAKRSPDEALPTNLTRCPYCGAQKCVMCDMGDDTECISCIQEDGE